STLTIRRRAAACGGSKTCPGRGGWGMTTGGGGGGGRGGPRRGWRGEIIQRTGFFFWGLGNTGRARTAEGGTEENHVTSLWVVALEAATGKRRWHFQFTPHDVYDWDATETPMLVDRMWKGRMRKLMFQANRNGFFYALDRETGEFLFGAPIARQTWAKGLDAK